jgi:RNA polymerase II subunit A small phosphatase-like protein
MLINEMPMKNSQSNIHISPTKNFKTNKSPFLTSQKEKKHKLYPKKNTLKSIISNNINNNYNTLFNRKKDPSLIFTPTKKSSKIKTQINTKKTLILDIDETLVHSGYTPQNRTPDITLNIKLNGFNRIVYVFKRPYVDEFLQEMSNIFEIVTFTASLSQYAGPLLDELDKFHTVSHRLFRENCISQKGIFIKDLRKIGKELKNIIIIDNNPMSYITNIDNGIPILTWYDNSNDDELMKLIPILKYLANVDDVRPIIKKIVDRRNNKIDFNIVNKIIKGNNNDKNNDNDNNKLNIIYGYNNNPPMNTENKEFDYKVISKNIRNSLSNMSYIDYVKNIDNQKNDNNSLNKIENKEVTNEDKKTNENIKINIYLKNDKTEDNSLKKNKIVNIKNALNSNKNYNKMSYNIKSILYINYFIFL